jgi:hypothetical protein
MSFWKLTQGFIVVPSDAKEMLFLTDCLSLVALGCVEVNENVMWDIT